VLNNFEHITIHPLSIMHYGLYALRITHHGFILVKAFIF